MRQTELLLDGKAQPSQSGAYFEVLAPATEQPLGRSARANAEDVNRAVALAQQGFVEWSALAPAKREACLLKAADIIEQQGLERLLELLMDESGSTIQKARFEIRYTVDLLRTAAGEARRLYGQTFPNDNPNRISMVLRQPLGVVAVVSPYNAPLSLLCKMTAFPLAAGNAVVIKPSEETPMIAVALGQILLEAGLPAKAISVLSGFGAECGAPLTEHPDVHCIALTGSTRTGQLVGASAARRMVRTQLELGGKSAALVLRDVDPAKAAAVVAQGIFTHSGQICMANSRAVVEAAIFDDFVAALKQQAEKLYLGDLRDERSAYGPLINRQAVHKVQQAVDEAVTAGATLLTGGKVQQGLVYQPTVLLHTPSHCTAWREELFGPVLSVIKVDNLAAGIACVNDSDYALSSAVLTKNMVWAMQAARAIQAGSVHIGMHAFQSNALAPIGGSKLSGVGRSGGAYSTAEFTDLKWISMELDDSL
ncbi:aldehyde dehydrogenase family protein [Alkalimonas sp. MEB108]|uniref:Aldehyde dehydrogenase family protein n=1 Tax=Alkalimonas cellulosilytica TaxID=3058395 RepID=A0ABU7J8S7_9GAMM|nr:aldehyde dehydrogenase family protein [Alkalimonas sp. MEB108]MEE2002953.1 aldehyde dehydrogenase family protein [Alkalimonas sp. MEB108]